MLKPNNVIATTNNRKLEVVNACAATSVATNETNEALANPLLRPMRRISIVAGIVVAIYRRKRHPLVSLLALIAFGLQLIALIIGSGLMYVTMAGGLGAQRIGELYAAVHLIRSTLMAASWVLIMLCVFGWRRIGVPAT